MFDCCGKFIDEIDFNDERLNELSRDESELAAQTAK